MHWPCRRRPPQRCSATSPTHSSSISASSPAFSRDGDKFMVRTDGPDGALARYQIAYTFGVYPLQQYLIAFPGRAAAGARHRLGQPRRESRAASAGSTSIPTRSSARRPAALDRARPDLELPVRRLPFHRSEEELRPRRRQLRDRPGPMSTCPARRATARARAMSRGPGQPSRPAPTDGRTQDGPDQLAEADRPRPLGDEPRDRHRPAHRASSVVDRARHLRRLPFAPQGDRQEPDAGRAVSRRLSAGAARARPLSRRRPDRRRGLRIRLVPAEPHVCTPGSPAPIATTRTARSCAPRAMRCARNAICRRSSTRPSIITTSPAAPARSASTATCRPRPTWSSMRGAITASACRGPICRCRSARRTPARSATPTGPPDGPQRPWPDGIPAGGRPRRITAPRFMPGGSERPMPSSSSTG